MKKIYKSLFGAALLSSLTLTTGCIEETMPTTDYITEKQLKESPTGAKALAMAMPANFNFASFFDVWAYDGWHNVFGYPAMMYIRDVMTGDFGWNTSSYTAHFRNWARNQYQGQDYRSAQYLWNYYYEFLLAANNCIASVDPASASDVQKGYLGAGLAFRAMLYLDLARMYEFLPTDKTNGINADGHDVTGLTVPIVKAGMLPADAANNPRATHEEMFNFIEADLLAAKDYIVFLKERQNNTLPDLACVNGLLARLYMWNEDYPKAQAAARAAINAATIQPITKEQYLDTKNGFNQAARWLWASSQTKEDWTIQKGIVNWASWISNQTTFGYTGPSTGLYNVVDKRMYERISNTDFRKLLFKAPKGSALAGQEPFLDPTFATNDDVPAYTAIKFRPGKGDAKEPTVGGVVDIPIMRLEEMYFIEAEAAEHVTAGEGVKLLTDFMKQYRDPSYTYASRDAIDEIVFQKRVELWGEGQTFFDIKRLNMPVTRGYSGTPFTELTRLNTTTRPAWMNIVIIQTESNNNKALENMNNPDPSDLYTPWTE